MRGEHDFSKIAFPETGGSSPHARGALESRPRARGRPGIIPACAGSTRIPSGTCRAARDHPRMRGEHRANRGPRAIDPGSSPHARGAPLSWDDLKTELGIIPACAGSTRVWGIGYQDIWDHPRMRGEHMRCRLMSGVYAGSSPHARGAPPSHEGAISLSGIIPACAGSTAYARSSRRPSRDHPRMRGEHSKRARVAPSTLGSSPHARGAHQPSPCHLLSLRIIPACAGST